MASWSRGVVASATCVVRRHAACSSVSLSVFLSKLSDLSVKHNEELFIIIVARHVLGDGDPSRLDTSMYMGTVRCNDAFISRDS